MSLCDREYDVSSKVTAVNVAVQCVYSLDYLSVNKCYNYSRPKPSCSEFWWNSCESSGSPSGKIWYTGLVFGLVSNRFEHFYTGPTLVFDIGQQSYPVDTVIISCLLTSCIS